MPSMSKVEEGLKKGMFHFGQFVEKVIGQAKKAKTSYETRTGIKPVLALESQIQKEKIYQLIDYVTDRFVISSIPELREKNSMEIGEGPFHYLHSFVERKAKGACGVLLGGSKPFAKGKISSAMVIRANSRSLPFDSQYYDYVVARFTTPFQSDLVGPVKELGRVMAPDATGVLIDFHPFGLFAKSGQERLRGVESSIRGLEDYYKMCRVARLEVTDIREAFIDDTLRNFFTTPTEMASFRELKGSPLVLCLFLMKTR